MSLSTTSTLLLDTSWGGDYMSSLGSLLQCLAMILEKFFLIIKLNLSWSNLKPSNHPL